jgi:hypothetical protein
MGMRFHGRGFEDKASICLNFASGILRIREPNYYLI